MLQVNPILLHLNPASSVQSVWDPLGGRRHMRLQWDHKPRDVCQVSDQSLYCATDIPHSGGISWGPFIPLQGITMLQVWLHPENIDGNNSHVLISIPAFTFRHGGTRPSQPWGRSCSFNQVGIMY